MEIEEIKDILSEVEKVERVYFLRNKLPRFNCYNPKNVQNFLFYYISLTTPPPNEPFLCFLHARSESSWFILLSSKQVKSMSCGPSGGT